MYQFILKFREHKRGGYHRSHQYKQSMAHLAEEEEVPHSLESDILVTEEPDVSIKDIVEECTDREIKTVVILVGMLRLLLVYSSGCDLTDYMFFYLSLTAAMEAEALPMVKSLNLVKDDPPVIAPPAPCISYSGSDWGMKVHLVCFGKCKDTGMDTVGTAPASLFTYLAIQAFSPDIVVSAGTAGGFKSKGASIADIFVATATVNHDRRIPIPGFQEYGVGKRLTLSAPAMRRELGLKAGVVSSGNSLDYTREDMALMEQHEAAVKEMEAAAVAWSASFFKCPLICLKSITDIVDGDKPAQDEFLENLHKSADALQAIIPKALQFMAGKKLSEL